MNSPKVRRVDAGERDRCHPSIETSRGCRHPRPIDGRSSGLHRLSAAGLVRSCVGCASLPRVGDGVNRVLPGERRQAASSRTHHRLLMTSIRRSPPPEPSPPVATTVGHRRETARDGASGQASRQAAGRRTATRSRRVVLVEHRPLSPDRRLVDGPPAVLRAVSALQSQENDISHLGWLTLSDGATAANVRSALFVACAVCLGLGARRLLVFSEHPRLRPPNDSAHLE